MLNHCEKKAGPLGPVCGSGSVGRLYWNSGGKRQERVCHLGRHRAVAFVSSCSSLWPQTAAAYGVPQKPCLSGLKTGRVPGGFFWLWCLWDAARARASRSFPAWSRSFLERDFPRRLLLIVRSAGKDPGRILGDRMGITRTASSPWAQPRWDFYV